MKKLIIIQLIGILFIITPHFLTAQHLGAIKLGINYSESYYNALPGLGGSVEADLYFLEDYTFNAFFGYTVSNKDIKYRKFNNDDFIEAEPEKEVSRFYEVNVLKNIFSDRFSENQLKIGIGLSFNQYRYQYDQRAIVGQNGIESTDFQEEKFVTSQVNLILQHNLHLSDHIILFGSAKLKIGLDEIAGFNKEVIRTDRPGTSISSSSMESNKRLQHLITLGIGYRF